MFRHIIVGVFLLITASVLAQEGTTSPYSYYGIGSLRFRGTVENQAMGGVGVFSDSIHINLQNPAAYSRLKLVNFSVGGSNKFTEQKNKENSRQASSTTLDYISMGIPMKDFGLGFGLIPYTAVGYHFFSERDGGKTAYKGSGGLNRAYVSLAYNVTPELSIGVEGNYNFGKIENNAVSKNDDLDYGTQIKNTSELMGFSVNVGAIYTRMITDKLELTSAVSYTPGTDFTSENQRRVATVNVLPTGEFPEDERDIDVPDTKFTFPSQFSIGAGIGKPKHWAVAAEYTNQKTSNFSNRAFTIENVDYVNGSKYSVGGYYIPNYNAFGSYLKRVVYRAGFRFEETGIKVSGHDIDEFGISFGLGLPVGRMFSNVNISVEVGTRGTTSFGLIQENFVNTSISFSLNDRWFQKALYD